MAVDHFFKEIGEAVGKQGFAKTKQDSWVALEFENETKLPFPKPDIPGYKYHTENSLRYHGFEYVFASPKPLAEVRGVSDTYFQMIHNARGKTNPLTNSARTSTHVHFDITRWTFVEALNWALVYWLAEPALSEFCGIDRQGNHFCLRYKDAMMAQSALTSSIKKCSPYSSSVFNPEYRYGSLNFNSWAKFGSMEFRMLQGVSDNTKLMDWVYILEKTRSYALKFKDPKELYKHFIHEIPAEEFMKLVFGEYYYLIMKHIPSGLDVTNEVRQAFMTLTPLMLSGGDWKFEKEREEEKKKKTTGQIYWDNSAATAVWQAFSIPAGGMPMFPEETTNWSEAELPYQYSEDFPNVWDGQTTLAPDPSIDL